MHLSSLLWRIHGEEGKEISIKKEYQGNDEHHVAHTLGSHRADIQQAEEVDISESTESGHLALLLIIYLQIEEIDHQSRKHSSGKHKQAGVCHPHGEERCHKHIAYQQRIHTYPLAPMAT